MPPIYMDIPFCVNVKTQLKKHVFVDPRVGADGSFDFMFLAMSSKRCYLNTTEYNTDESCRIASEQTGVAY